MAKILPNKDKIYVADDGQIKQCFCVGPENCEDETCELVRKFKEKNEIPRQP